MILYIHGFASCGWGVKSKTLNKYFKVLAPDLEISPKKALKQLEIIIQNNPIKALVGASLGGFYARYLAEKYNLKAILINPALLPIDTLYKYIGKNKRWCDNQEFIITKEDIEELKLFETDTLNSKYLVLLQSGDEVLDYKIALNKFKSKRVIVEYGGNHRFENIDDYISMIQNFIKD